MSLKSDEYIYLYLNVCYYIYFSVDEIMKSTALEYLSHSRTSAAFGLFADQNLSNSANLELNEPKFKKNVMVIVMMPIFIPVILEMLFFKLF